MTVAYQGVPGAFSHGACLAYCADHEPVGRPTFAAVVESVLDSDTDCGMLPVENRIAGAVSEAVELLENDALVEVSRHEMPIRLHLMGLPETELAAVTTATSHPVALKQCAATLAQLGIAPRSASNTAVAAQSLSDPSVAALASEAAAEAYGLTILRRDMQDRSDNHTTFVLFERANP